MKEILQPYYKLLSECTWIGFKATDEERKLIKRYAERLREAGQEGVWVDPLERKMTTGDYVAKWQAEADKS